ncbi:MAG: DUF2339 domain-containing protein [Holophagaceae bacterium]|nr:DUF2339 domain-containing protein [Holophagaceae bacterium]
MTDQPDGSDLAERVKKLEDQVAWLTAQAQAAALAAPAAVGAPPRPVPRPGPPPRPPRLPKPPTETNPMLWIGGIGAGILLLGVIFFLGWTIQQGYLGPGPRLLLGLAAGSAMTFGAAMMIVKGTRKLGVCVLAAGLGTLLLTLYYGTSTDPKLLSSSLGFAGIGLAIMFGGGLAAKAESGGALVVTLIIAFWAPIAFSEGGHHEVALTLYLGVLMAAALAVPYLAKVGARWGVARWVAVTGLWILLAAASLSTDPEDAFTMLLLLGFHALLSALWIWLPGQGEAKPRTPTILWFLVSLSLTSLAWALWKKLAWTPEWFAGPALLFAAVNLGMVKPLRARLGSKQADLGLLVLAAGHLALAVPIAMHWKWVGPMWGAFALGLAWAAGRAEGMEDWEESEIASLRRLAFGMAVLASIRWLVGSVDVWEHTFSYRYSGNLASGMPVLNGVFAEGLLVSAAWLLMARRKGAMAVLAFLALEFTANLTLALEAARIVHAVQASGLPTYADYGGRYLETRGASIAVTLVWALSGAMQWLRSFAAEDQGVRRALAVGGYVWLAIASLKLLGVDTSQASAGVRALAFLAVGGIFLTVALLANKMKRRPGEAA